MSVRAISGRAVEDITVQAALSGELGPSDTRIHPDGLRRQAAVAAAHDNPELGDNLLRAAELAVLSDAEILAIYEALRPRRSSRKELEAIANRLDAAAAPRCAALVREAVTVYERRQLLK
jgi:propanediol dehydratase small subunit